MSNETPIRDWSGDYWFLDNSYTSPVMFQGVTYPSVTHAMMGAQADTLLKRLNIAKAPLGQLEEIFAQLGDPPKEFRGPDTMKALLEAKFGYSANLIEMTESQVKLSQRLLATGVRKVVFANKVCEQFWGDCDCPKHKDIKGNNVLGGLIEGVRERLAGYVTRNVAKDQTCSCEKPASAFFMYSLHGKLWLKPFCEECQVKIGMFLAKSSDNNEVTRFEKSWFPSERGPATTPKTIREPVNRIKVQRTIHPVFMNDQFEDEEYLEEWRARMGWNGHMAGFMNRAKEVEKKLPQNVTFYLSGRIS